MTRQASLGFNPYLFSPFPSLCRLSLFTLPCIRRRCHSSPAAAPIGHRSLRSRGLPQPSIQRHQPAARPYS